ncbi:MAG: exo-alpha-sialidase [Actinobacteria bacterium]|uniref:Unannotated protein n=1 Tax=freshwater metagenome TaxID=449393 RepID=A0A6J7AQ92_9ZZZZ|nr:exo-alpha-sialidase [Actinomycetota bacterium]
MVLTPARAVAAAALAVASGLILTACGGTGATSATVSAPAVDGAALPAHVHNLAYNADTLLFGTHEGLWEQAPGQVPKAVSQEAFDVMGFTQNGDRWLASGHPAAGSTAPGSLGLLESTDEGVTWSPVALSGEVDFHRLVAAGDQLFGINSADNALLRSDDGGRSWTSAGAVPLFDLAVAPDNPDTLLGTTADGPVISTDAGTTFEAAPAPALIAFLAWTPRALVGVAADGQVLESTDRGANWQAKGRVAGPPAAVAADGSRVAVLAGGVVYESTDNGATFTQRVTGITGH